jgi:dTDP-4-dehydrorhamnose reductase
MKRILVTGSNGFIGQKLTQTIIHREGIELIATSRGFEKNRFYDGYIYETLDITSSAEVEYIIGEYRPDAIINTAALSGADYCEDNKEECWRVNVEGLGNLINVVNKHGIHLMQLSTDFVFDGLNGPYREEDTPCPVSWYGQTKVEGEQLLADTCDSWSVVRTILVYGITPGMKRSNLLLWVKKNLENLQPIKVVNDQFRMPTFADDLVKGCLAILAKNLKGIYHISGNDMMSIYEIAVRVADFYRLDNSLLNPVSSSELNEHAKRPVKTGFILDKAERDLNYVPLHFDESLKLFDQQLNDYFI